MLIVFIITFTLTSCPPTTLSLSLSLSPLIASEYGLFNPDDDPTKGRWLEQGRSLDYYHLKNGVSSILSLSLPPSPFSPILSLSPSPFLFLPPSLPPSLPPLLLLLHFFTGYIRV